MKDLKQRIFSSDSWKCTINEITPSVEVPNPFKVGSIYSSKDIYDWMLKCDSDKWIDIKNDPSEPDTQVSFFISDGGTGSFAEIYFKKC